MPPPGKAGSCRTWKPAIEPLRSDDRLRREGRALFREGTLLGPGKSTDAALTRQPFGSEPSEEIRTRLACI